jgi:hypothetical protein
MKEKLGSGIRYSLIAGYLVVVSGLVILAVDQAINLVRLQAEPVLNTLSLGALGQAIGSWSWRR